MTRNDRIAELVTTPGTVVKPSEFGGGYVVVVDGRTGRDACERTADDAFDVLFAELDKRSEAGENDETSEAPASRPQPDFTEKLGEFPSDELRQARLKRNEAAAAAKGF